MVISQLYIQPNDTLPINANMETQDNLSVYRVMFENNKPVAVKKSTLLSHGDMAVNDDNTVRWYAVESDNEILAQKAAEIAVTKTWQSAYPAQDIK